MRFLQALWGVGVSLVVGDDPKIAVAVVLSLALAAGLLVTGVAPTALVMVGGAVLVGAAFAVTLHLDTRHVSRRPHD